MSMLGGSVPSAPSAPSAPAGAAVSNTAPANRPLSLPCVLASGVDTLILNVYADLPVDLLTDYERIRDLSREVADSAGLPPCPAVVPLTFAGLSLSVLPFGRRGWSVVLHNDWLDISLGRGGVSGVTARLRLSAAFLWSRTFDEALSQVVGFVSDWLGMSAAETLQPSEIHLARDLAVDFSSGDIQHQFVTRARKVQAVTRRVVVEDVPSVRVETIAVGARSGAVSAAIYDKSLEVVESGKLWMRDLWAASGWLLGEPVWRVEYRLRREFLSEYRGPGAAADGGLQDVWGLLDALPSLWRYCTVDWLRVTDCQPGDSVDVREARPLVSSWQVLASPFLLEDEPVAEMVRERKHAADAAALAAQAAGCLVSMFALTPEVATFTIDDFVAGCAAVLGDLERRRELPLEQVVLSRQVRLFSLPLVS